MVTAVIDEVAVRVPANTLIIRAAELLGTWIPRFCDHPLLDPVAACRQCLVMVDGMPKPQPACAIGLTEGMVVRTQATSPVAAAAQAGVMEFLLINHPLDCPVCDKGGECPLQNQAMTAGRLVSRFTEPKRTFPKPLAISSQILLDRERCVSCARCTRFSDQIAGDPFIDLLERGSAQQVGIGDGVPFDSYFSGNTIQICPVGALTSSSYRFRSRPFDLVSTPTVCEHCAAGCALRTDVRRGQVMRRLAWEDPAVNEEWNCDKGRFAFTYLTHERLTEPLIRDRAGVLQRASWSEAISHAASLLAPAMASGRSAVLTGGRLTWEDACGYARFARAVLGTDDVDFRNRPASPAEADFLSRHIAGTPMGPTYDEITEAPLVMVVAADLEDECPILLLRLRAAVRRGATQVAEIAPVATGSQAKLRATRVNAAAGREGAVLAALNPFPAGTVIVLGERAATIPGLFDAVARRQAAGARVLWCPRRAGERGALEAGLLPGLLPGGRPLTDPQARAEVARAWGVDPQRLPTASGRDQQGIIAAAAAGELDALLVGGVDVRDAADPHALRAALARVPVLISLEQRHSEVTERAHVVLPVAAVTEKAGTFIDIEGRARPFPVTNRESAALADARVLALLADEIGVPLGPQTVPALRTELAALGRWSGARPVSARTGAAPTSRTADLPAGAKLLATWHQLLDAGVLQRPEPALAGTQRPPVARLSAAAAQRLGLRPGEPCTVRTGHGSVTLPLAITEMDDDTVWLPTNSPGSAVRSALLAAHGDEVTVEPATAVAVTPGDPS